MEYEVAAVLAFECASREHGRGVYHVNASALGRDVIDEVRGVQAFAGADLDDRLCADCVERGAND